MILSLEGYINLLMKCCGARDLLWGSAIFMLYVCVLSYAQPFVTPWAVVYQAPLSMGLLWQEDWSRLPSPSPGDLPKWGNDPSSLVSPALFCLVTFCDPIDHRPLGFSVHGNSPGKNTGVDCHDLHQGILAS